MHAAVFQSNVYEGLQRYLNLRSAARSTENRIQTLFFICTTESDTIDMYLVVRIYIDSTL